MKLLSQHRSSCYHLSGFIALLLIALLLRLPYFFDSVINWDESTFILAGQSITQGGIPYVDFFDLKAPLAFLPYAGLIELFGNNIIGIRLGALFFVIVSAAIVYYIMLDTWGRAGALGSAFLTVLYLSSQSNFQPLMTEHIALVPLLGALAMIQNEDCCARKCFLAGIYMSLAVLVRLNLAYCAVFAGLFLLFSSSGTVSLFARLRHAAFYGLGGLVPVSLVVLFYMATGHLDALDLFIRNAIGYSTEQLSPLLLLRTLPGLLIMLPFLSMCAICALTTGVEKRHVFSAAQKRSILLNGLFLLGIITSIVLGGIFHPHYVIQLVPFMAMLAGAFLFTGYYFSSRLFRNTAIAVVAAVICLNLWQGYVYYKEHVSQPDTAREIREYLQKNTSSQQSIYLMQWHIVYWFMGIEPFNSFYLHPSNVAKDSQSMKNGPTMPTEEKLEKLLESNPDYIVKPQDLFYLRKYPLAENVLNRHLTEKCFLKTLINDEAYIYQCSGQEK